ncbi:hypothetical protein DYY67_0057 [Candidatus Nitrosotalea sp. TS]|nr:hypothetical protein [Candidatus Nitrosotalea sp. TS]
MDCVGGFDEQHRVALMSCIEVVIMRRNSADFHLIQARLNAICNRNFIDCYEYPTYLRDILQDVYGENYSLIIDEVKLHLGEDLIAEQDIAHFFKIMEN